MTTVPDGCFASNTAEQHLAVRDPTLGRVIKSQTLMWPHRRTEHPIGGLVRIVMAQQVSTRWACNLAERARCAFPKLTAPRPEDAPDVLGLRALGLSRSRAECCSEIVRRCNEILAKIEKGHSWEQSLIDIKGIGPWTISVFRIMVLREPDVLPLGDVGLERAIVNVYGRRRDVERLGERWRPFRSVACWYLWRTLGNEQLG